MAGKRIGGTAPVLTVITTAASTVLVPVYSSGTDANSITVANLAGTALKLGTLAGVFTTTGAFTLNLNVSANTNVTLPTTGTLATLAGSEALTGKTLNGLAVTTTAGTLTIANNASAALVTSGNFSLTLTSTATTVATFPAGTVTLAQLGANTFTGLQLITSSGSGTNQSGGATPNFSFVGALGSGIDAATGRLTLFAGGYPIANLRSDNNQVAIAAAATFGWAPGADLGTSPDTSLGRGGIGLIKFMNAGSFTANATTATLMTSLGPAGANTTIQEWLTIVNNSGTTRYIPCY